MAVVSSPNLFAQDIKKMNKGEQAIVDGYFVTPSGLAKIQAKNESDAKICEIEKKSLVDLSEVKEEYCRESLEVYKEITNPQEVKEPRLSSETKIFIVAASILAYTALILYIDDRFDKRE